MFKLTNFSISLLLAAGISALGGCSKCSHDPQPVPTDTATPLPPATTAPTGDPAMGTPPPAAPDQALPDTQAPPPGDAKNPGNPTAPVPGSK